MLKNEGFLLVKNFFSKNKITKIKKEMEYCFELISKRNHNEIDKDIIELFKKDTQSFLGWANLCQNLLSLHRLSSSKKIENLLKKLGLNKPTINTRPLLSLSCKSLSKHDSHWKVPSHQDWPSTRGSLNGVTVWIPLVGINKDIGPLEIAPKSHLLGFLEHHNDGLVPIISKLEDRKFISNSMNVGDILIFNYFTIHKSGLNINLDKIRWSVHFRYDDAEEKTFIERKYPRYKKEIRSDENIDSSFPNLKQIEDSLK